MRYQVRNSGTLKPYPLWVSADDEAGAAAIWEARHGSPPDEIIEIKSDDHANELTRALSKEAG